MTDRIETFTEDGIRLASGRELEADIVVTATGLNVQAMGGVTIDVDGQDVALADTVSYKGMMLSGVPNFAYAIGYTNSSWTLKIGLLCEHFCRLLALHGRAWIRRGTARRRGPGDASCGPSWTSAPATSSARSTSCPARVTRRRG